MKYMISIYRAADYKPSLEDEKMKREIDALNDEMVSAGVRIFVGGLQAPSTATSVCAEDVGVSDGPYLKSLEYIGGFWVVEVVDPNDALYWAKKAARACKAAVEIRPFN